MLKLEVNRSSFKLAWTMFPPPPIFIAIDCFRISTRLAGMNVVPLEQLSYETFSRLVKMNFRVWIGDHDSIDLELFEITRPRVVATSGANCLTYENFTLVLLGPADRILPQRIYAFESAATGRFEMFIVPVSSGPSGTCYEATFNLLVKPA